MTFVPLYDLESLNEQQRQDYIRNVCAHMGVPPELNLVMLTYLDEDGDGPRRLVAYAKRGATEIIRNNRGINITDLTNKEIGGSIVFTATAKDNTGRQEMSTGSKWIKDLTGKDLDDAIMTSQTRACRRVTLQFVGAGVLDESEVNPSRPVATKETAFTGMAVAPQPTVQPSSEPGKDVTAIATTVIDHVAGTVVHETVAEEFSKEQEKLRQDAIAQLNAKFAPPVESAPAEEPKKRKYTRKARVDLGPSEPPVKASTVFQVPVETLPATITVPAHVGTHVELVQTPVPGTAVQALPQIIMVPPSAPVATGKPRLSPEQVKPYRQRQFKFVNELEENGFLPKEGMGNQDKMRAFAGIMFSEVTNFNELTADQWEKYLTTIETKLKTVGAKETIKYIEEAIGL
jgi:hypothetical protein